MLMNFCKRAATNDTLINYITNKRSIGGWSRIINSLLFVGERNSLFWLILAN